LLPFCSSFSSSRLSSSFITLFIHSSFLLPLIFLSSSQNFLQPEESFYMTLVTVYQTTQHYNAGGRHIQFSTKILCALLMSDVCTAAPSSFVILMW
jgi:hypothetical protein